MEETHIHNLIREKFLQLPEKLQQALTSSEIAEKLRKIVEKYRLHIDQGQVLENETYMVLLGIEDAERYEDNIRKALSISETEAREIGNEVANEVFLEVRENLKLLTTKAPETRTTPYETLVPTMGNKLSEVVKNKNQEMRIGEGNPPYRTDPYREPLK